MLQTGTEPWLVTAKNTNALGVSDRLGRMVESTSQAPVTVNAGFDDVSRAVIAFRNALFATVPIPTCAPVTTEIPLPGISGGVQVDPVPACPPVPVAPALPAAEPPGPAPPVVPAVPVAPAAPPVDIPGPQPATTNVESHNTPTPRINRMHHLEAKCQGLMVRRLSRRVR